MLRDTGAVLRGTATAFSRMGNRKLTGYQVATILYEAADNIEKDEREDYNAGR